MEFFDAVLANPWLGIFGLSVKSDAFHPTGPGYAVATVALLIIGTVLGRLSKRGGRRIDDATRRDRRIEPLL